jgi:tRNA threonylcarbamoyladenosine biosynthesis protein TsaE
MAKYRASSTFKFRSSSPEDTARLAGLFAGALRGGTALFLEGPIGSGKTFFVRELARALGARRLPVSASFNLMRSYSGRLKLYHFDLFRAGEADMENIGLDEYLGRPDGVTAVEWPGEAGAVYAGMEPLRFEFELAGGDSRIIKVSAPPASAAPVKAIEAKWLKK